jgi:hypothetical protein
MNIVASSYFLRNLRNLPFFTLDFGKARKDSKTSEFRKVDEFIVKYRTLYNRPIVKFGKIGDSIKFYEDLSMENNEYAIFKDDDIYEITFTSDEISNIEEYILDTLRKIDDSENEEKQIEEHNEKMVREIVGSEVWIATDEKNKGKSYSIDQTLSREKYREALKHKIKLGKK